MSIDMADLPGTFEDFMKEVGSTSRLEAIAREAGAAGECFCGNATFELDLLSAAVRAHYDLSGTQETAFIDYATGTELDFTGGSVCGYHENAMSKDD